MPELLSLLLLSFRLLLQAVVLLPDDVEVLRDFLDFLSCDLEGGKVG